MPVNARSPGIQAGIPEEKRNLQYREMAYHTIKTILGKTIRDEETIRSLEDKINKAITGLNTPPNEVGSEVLLKAAETVIGEAKKTLASVKEEVNKLVKEKGIIPPSRIRFSTYEKNIRWVEEKIAKSKELDPMFKYHHNMNTLEYAVSSLKKVLDLSRKLKPFIDSDYRIIEKVLNGESISFEEVLRLVEYYHWEEIYKYVSPFKFEIEVPEDARKLLSKVFSRGDKEVTPLVFFLSRNYAGFVGEHVLVAWRHGGVVNLADRVVFAESPDKRRFSFEPLSGFSKAVREAVSNGKVMIEVGEKGLLVNGELGFVEVYSVRDAGLARLLEKSANLDNLASMGDFKLNVAIASKTFTKIISTIPKIYSKNGVFLRDDGNIVITEDVEVDRKLTGLEIIHSTGRFGTVGVVGPEFALALREAYKVKGREPIIVYGKTKLDENEYSEFPVMIIAGYGEPSEVKLMVANVVAGEVRGSVKIRDAVRVRKTNGLIGFLNGLGDDSSEKTAFNYNGRLTISTEATLETNENVMLAYLGPEKSWDDERPGPFNLVDSLDAVRILTKAGYLPVKQAGENGYSISSKTRQILESLEKGAGKKIASFKVLLSYDRIGHDKDGILLVYDEDTGDFQPVDNVQYSSIAWFLDMLLTTFPAKTAHIDVYKLSERTVFKARLDKPSGVEIIGF